MQEHFGNTMNLARIKLMTYVINTFVQTVSLHKLVATIPTTVKRDSNMRRFQLFFAKYALNLYLIARMIFRMLTRLKAVVLAFPAVSSIHV